MSDAELKPVECSPGLEDRAAFEAWMDQPVAAGDDPAPWLSDAAEAAAWQAWKARSAEIERLRAELAAAQPAQPVATVTECDEPEHGHWYSPNFVRAYSEACAAAAVAAERAACVNICAGFEIEGGKAWQCAHAIRARSG